MVFFSSFCPQESGYNHIYDNSIGGVATISDSNGDLLFYTDGVNVFNKNHQIMLNGNDIGINDTPSKQHAIIVPHTQNKD